MTFNLRARRTLSVLVSGCLGVVLGMTLMFGGIAFAHLNVNCSGGDCHGDEHDNDINGTGNYDAIYAGQGQDRAQAESWGDLVNGGMGDDLLYGGGGDDALNGHEGWDFYILSGGEYAGIHGRDGEDHINGNDGEDVLSGGNGNDYLDGGANDGNHDHCKGGSGTDVADYCHVHGAGDPTIQD